MQSKWAPSKKKQQTRPRRDETRQRLEPQPDANFSLSCIASPWCASEANAIVQKSICPITTTAWRLCREVRTLSTSVGSFLCAASLCVCHTLGARGFRCDEVATWTLTTATADDKASNTLLCRIFLEISAIRVIALRVLFFMFHLWFFALSLSVSVPSGDVAPRRPQQVHEDTSEQRTESCRAAYQSVQSCGEYDV